MSTVGRPQRYLLRNKICVSEVIDLTQSPTSTSTGIRNDVGTFTSITAATAASPRISAVIDLIQSPSRPQPITSTGIQDAANVATATAITGIAAGTPSDVSSTMQTAIVTAASQNTDLYAQLQNLEGQEGVIWNAEQMFCALCDLFVGIGGGILVRNCLHQICTICIKKVIVECATIDVKCPIFDCHYSLQDREIHSLLTQSEYERHMNKSTVIDDTNLYKDLLDLEQQGLIYNTESFECKICFTEIDVSQGILIRECLHQYCIDCMRHTINLSEEARIKCPAVDCSCYIHDREIHALLSQEEFDKYTAKTLRIAESQEANSYHCKLANCGGWCIVEDEVNTFDCPVCSSVNCLSCQVNQCVDILLAKIHFCFKKNNTSIYSLFLFENIFFSLIHQWYRSFILVEIVNNIRTKSVSLA